METADTDQLLSTPKLAKILGVSTHTVHTSITPTLVTPAGRRFYRLAAVREQMAHDRRTAGDAA